MTSITSTAYISNLNSNTTVPLDINQAVSKIFAAIGDELLFTHILTVPFVAPNPSGNFITVSSLDFSFVSTGVPVLHFPDLGWYFATDATPVSTTQPPFTSTSSNPNLTVTTPFQIITDISGDTANYSCFPSQTYHQLTIGGTNAYYVLQLKFRILNTPSNQDGVDYALTFTPTTSPFSTPLYIDVTLVEPIVTIISILDNTLPILPADSLKYTITLTAHNTTAYTTILTFPPNSMIILPAGWTVPTNHPNTAEILAFLPGTATFTVTLPANVGSNNPVFYVTWKSNTTIFARDGTGGVNDYYAESRSSINVVTPEVQWILETPIVKVNQDVIYVAVLTVPPGSYNITLTPNVPSSLSIVESMVVTTAALANGYLSADYTGTVTPLTGTEPLTLAVGSTGGSLAVFFTYLATASLLSTGSSITVDYAGFNITAYSNVLIVTSALGSQQSPGLLLEKIVSNISTFRGVRIVTYVITVTNLNTLPLTNLVLTDILPFGTVSSSSDWLIDTAGNPYQIISVLPLQTLSFTIPFTANSAVNSIQNTAVVSLNGVILATTTVYTLLPTLSLCIGV
jgi:hypothetical protein